MSETRVRNLFDDAARNPKLMAQLADADDIEKFLGIAQEHGYDFSADDLKRVVDASAATGGELTEDELAQAAGGISYPTLQKQYPTLVRYLAGVAPLRPAEFNIGMPPKRSIE